MAQAPKKKRKLPKNITERPDSEALEMILGKRVKKELDKEIEKAAEGVGKKGDRGVIQS